MDIRRDIHRLGGFAATFELYRLGWTRRSLRHSVESGTSLRVRQGWYCTPDADPDEIAAFRVGGRLGCVSAAYAHGLWVRRPAIVHVDVPTHSSRHRSPHDRFVRLGDSKKLAVRHWSPGWGRPVARASVVDSLLAMALCQPVERVVAAADSALHLGLMSGAQWRSVIAPLPRRLRRLLAQVDSRSESITESIVRFRLARLGIEVHVQVAIVGVGRVDFVVGSRLVIEVDGRQYHIDPERFENDRRRDARLSAMGYRVLRFSYNQVMNRWSEVKAAIVAAIARGDHLPPA
jgi:very-short-patch-repair endonuclease